MPILLIGDLRPNQVRLQQRNAAKLTLDARAVSIHALRIGELRQRLLLCGRIVRRIFHQRFSQLEVHSGQRRVQRNGLSIVDDRMRQVPGIDQPFCDQLLHAGRLRCQERQLVQGSIRKLCVHALLEEQNIYIVR
jgi:hypothetical protein